MQKLLIISIILGTISCEPQMEQFNELKRASDIYLLLLSASETTEVNDSLAYVGNREVLRQVRLTDEQRGSFIGHFTKKANYEPLNRRCKFEPVYALKIDGKIYATFDVEYCPTIQFMTNEEVPDLLGITTDNTLKTAIDEILPEQ